MFYYMAAGDPVTQLVEASIAMAFTWLTKAEWRKLVDPDNGLSPSRCQAINETHSG